MDIQTYVYVSYRSFTRRYINTIFVYNLPWLCTSNFDISDKRKWLCAKKLKSRNNNRPRLCRWSSTSCNTQAESMLNSLEQLCTDKGGSLEVLLGAMDNRERWSVRACARVRDREWERERVRKIHAVIATWWYIYIYIYIFTFGLIPLEKVWISLSPPAMDLIVSLLFYKDGFDIRLPTKVNMPSNKDTKPNHQYINIYIYIYIYI